MRTTTTARAKSFLALGMTLALGPAAWAQSPASAPASAASAAVAAVPAASAATPAASAASAPRPAASATSKDIVLDSPAVRPADSRSALPASAPPDAARRLQAAPALADLGLHLARHAAQQRGSARTNHVASPYSVAIALGMLHEGSAGRTGTEIAGVLEPATTGGRLLRSGLARLPAVVKGDASTEWLSPSRVWVARSMAASVPAVVQERLRSAFAADGMTLDFAASPEAARSEINRWAGAATQGLVPQLLPDGSVRPDTRLVITNAAYFKGQWDTPFNPSSTQPGPFQAEGGVRQVPTMHGVLPVREGTIDGVYVLELPFEGHNFGMLLALPPEGHTLQALENDLLGADIAGWAGQLKPARVDLALPKFRIAAAAGTLDDALKAAGMATAFTDGADFSPLLGSKGVKLDHVFHSAAIDVNEQGTVAVAATAATGVMKSLTPASIARRSFDRPFLFVLLHKPTGVPLFVGRVADPQEGR